MSEYVLNFDGSCAVNPGPNAGWGYTIKKDGQFFRKDSGELAGRTYSNNYAEFFALYQGLLFLEPKIGRTDKLFVRGDSQLVIKIMQNRWKAKEGLYKDAYILAKEVVSKIRLCYTPVSFDWVPREMNTEADALSTLYSSTSGEKR